jgi:hypothetical protein
VDPSGRCIPAMCVSGSSEPRRSEGPLVLYAINVLSQRHFGNATQRCFGSDFG